MVSRPIVNNHKVVGAKGQRQSDVVIKRTILYIVMSVILLAGQGHARPGGDVFVAEGAAPIGDDMGLTRDIAILRAKQAALEKAGMGLSSETMVDMGLLLDDIIKIQTFGLIQTYKILWEKDDGQQYRVKIKARVVPKAQGKAALKNYFAQRSIRMECAGEASAKIERMLLNRLTHDRYFVLAQGFAQWPPDYTVKIASSVIYDQAVHGIEAYRVTCNLGLIQRSTHRLLISVQAPRDNRIYGLNREQAIQGNGPNGYAQKIATPMVDVFMDRLNARARDQLHDVHVVVYGLPDYRTFREQFCRMIRTLRLGIKDVANPQYNGKTGRVTVSYGEKTDYLAALIGFRSQYTINKTTWDKIDVVYQKR